MALQLLAGAAMLVSIAIAALRGTTYYVPSACSNVEQSLKRNVLGQDLAVSLITDSICQHVSDPEPNKLLLMSVHGPPGVGKTLTHRLLGKALYNKNPDSAKMCPGKDCSGYMVLFGMDYMLVEREQQLTRVRDAVVEHLQGSPEGLVVIEEYDKLSCAARSMLRQLVQYPHLANITTRRGMILLESNVGIAPLEELASASPDGQVAAEAADRVLRDMVFSHWQQQGCESLEDSLKLTSLVDWFVPYFPLRRGVVRQVFANRLRGLQEDLAQRRYHLSWGSEVLEHLVGLVDFDGPYALDGASKVWVKMGPVLQLLRRLPQYGSTDANTTVLLELDTNQQLVLQTR